MNLPVEHIVGTLSGNLSALVRTPGLAEYTVLQNSMRCGNVNLGNGTFKS